MLQVCNMEPFEMDFSETIFEPIHTFHREFRCRLCSWELYISFFYQSIPVSDHIGLFSCPLVEHVAKDVLFFPVVRFPDLIYVCELAA